MSAAAAAPPTGPNGSAKSTSRLKSTTFSAPDTFGNSLPPGGLARAAVSLIERHRFSPRVRGSDCPAPRRGGFPLPALFPWVHVGPGGRPPTPPRARRASRAGGGHATYPVLSARPRQRLPRATAGVLSAPVSVSVVR